MLSVHGPPLETNLVGSTRIQNKRTRRSRACDYCRDKKIRCNGSHRNSCANCLDRKQTCAWSSHRRLRLKDQDQASLNLAARLARIETLLQQTPTCRHAPELASSSSPQSQLSVSFELNPTHHMLQAVVLPPLSPDEDNAQHITRQPPPSNSRRPLRTLTENEISQNPIVVARETSLSSQPNASGAYASPSNLNFNTDVDNTLGTVFGSQVSTGNEVSTSGIREWSSIASSETSNWEYHGPDSYLSICSKPGIQWVCNKSRGSDFGDAAKRFTTYITRRLKMEKNLSNERRPDPDEESAWRYTKAYFDEALDAALGIVHRPWFEAQLNGYFRGSMKDMDPAWHALRNAIFATGCRIETSKSMSFRAANQLAWGWFENALSAHTEILYFRTSIVGVQALTVMAYYSQNIGSPCLEYMLCANAMRLAVAKGLHRQAASLWNLGNHEVSQRNCIFWGVYCLEKQIACQSGRPSIIDDDDINCEAPTVATAGSSLNLEFCNNLVKLARLQSLSAKRLSSIRNSRTRAERLVQSIAELHTQLEAIKRVIDPIISASLLCGHDQPPRSMRKLPAIYLQWTYYTTALNIHTSLSCPWSRDILGMPQDSAMNYQVKQSIQIVAETCRAAIMATEYIHLTASTPVPLSFFGPIYVLINLFVHILQNPKDSYSQQDLTLMDVGAGFFARLQIATESEISISFAKEMAFSAYNVAKSAPSKDSSNEVSCDPLTMSQCPCDTADTSGPVSHAGNDTDINEGCMSSFFDFGPDDGSVFVPAAWNEELEEFSFSGGHQH